MSGGSGGGSGGGSRTGRPLVLFGVVALALNLRPAAVSVGPVLDEIRADLAMSAAQAGVLTALPVIAFAVFGALASWLGARLGPHRLTALALLGVVVGQLARSRVDGVAAFLALSLLALAGMATANVVLPSLVKLHFPDRVGTLTAIYSTGLAVGLTGASVLTVPVSDAAGDWRDGLAVWALLAVVAVVPWLALARHDTGRGRDAGAARIPLGAVARTRLGWLMAALFGLQALQAYAIFGWFAAIFRDAGFSSATAGLLLGVVTASSIPLSYLAPSLAGRLTDLTPLVLVIGGCYPVGYLGLAFVPALAPLWAVVVGIGTTTFPLVLALIGLRARTPEGTAALSAFTQSAGYLLAAVGPLGVGLLHDLTGEWVVPLAALSLLAVPLMLCGLRVARPRYLEDELSEASGS